VSDVISIVHTGAVATITLNRPDSLNALNAPLKEGLLAAITEVSVDPAVRAVVLTGAGRGFCVGQDLDEHLDTLRAHRSLREVVAEHYNPIILGLATMPKPVIAAVNGPAAGAGAGLALACDLRIASTSSSFLLAFARVGLSLDSGVSWTLPRLIGAARATALALLAEPVPAEAALEMGLINAMVEPEHVLPTALEIATRLAAGPTAAYAAIKDVISFAANSSLADALAYEAGVQEAVGRTADHHNATEAFLAKSSAEFTGH
jgi:2-(1,2-epoxy-1,2-dihydrophenyl)acetyl-CoA isomerase